MSLRVVDKLVREGKYTQAMRALDRARELYPDNPYIPAYEERLRALLSRGDSPIPPPDGLLPEDTIAGLSSASLTPEMPSAEGQMKSIAVPITRNPGGNHGTSLAQELKRQEERRLALLAKIASLLRKASEYLESKEFDKALQEIWRASLLDPTNHDVLALEARAKSAKEKALLQQKAEEERAEKEQEALREQHRQQELARLQHEEEERQRIEEDARKQAENTKIQMCLTEARARLDAGRFKEAETELSFALVIEPTHAEALALLEEIRRKAEEARLAEVERIRKEEERRRLEQERIRAEVSAAISTACQAAKRKDFQEALEIVTRAYVIDPENAGLQSCEREIVAERDEWTRQQEEEQRKRELELHEQREKERRRLEEEERLRVIKGRLAQVEARRQAAEREMNLHLQRSREFLGLGEFEKALAEVALAFKTNPLAQEVKDVEQLILKAQAEARSVQDSDATEVPEEESVDPEILARIASHLAAASDFATRHEYTRAFDEIAQAYAMDPLDETIEECERVIQEQFTQFLERQNAGRSSKEEVKQSPPAPLPAPAPSTPEPAVPVPTNADAAEEPEGRPGTLARILGFLGRKRKVVLGLAATSCCVVAFAIVTTTRSSTDIKASNPGRSTQEGAASGELQSATIEQPPLAQPSRPTEKATPSTKPDREPSTSVKTVTSPETNAKAARQEQKPAEDTLGRNVGQGLQAAQLPEDRSNVPVERMNQSTAALKTNPLDLAPADPPRVGKPAEVVRLQKPVLSSAAEKVGAVGEVIVRVEIGADGKPLSASVVRSSNPLLNEAVIEAVMNSEYRPGISANGEGSTWLTIPFKFVK